MKGQRAREVIRCLLESDHPVSAQGIADHLAVSLATVYNELAKVEAFISVFNCRLQRERGLGLMIQGDPQDVAELDFAVNGAHVLPEQTIKDDFANIALYLLHKKEEYCTIDEMSRALFMSRSAVQYQLSFVAEIFKNNAISIDIRKKKGVKVWGEERAIRSLYSKLLSQDSSLIAGTFTSSAAVQDQIYQLLHVDATFIFKVLKDYESILGYTFTDESFDSLAIHIAIAIKRIMEGNRVKHPESYSVDDYQSEYRIAENMCLEIGQAYNIVFDTNEIYYLFLHIISTKMIQDPSIILKIKELPEDDDAKVIADEIIGLVSNMMQIEIVDRSFTNNLIIHLRPTLNRLEFGLTLKNPLLDKIKQEYAESYGIAWMTNRIFRQRIGKDISEDEAAYLAIHIQSMIEASKRNLKVIVVCSSGVGIAQLLATRIRQHFKQIEIIAIESVASFSSRRNEKNADLVVSTFPIKTDLPVLIVNPLLNENDKLQLKSFLDYRMIKGHNRWEFIKIEMILHADVGDQAALIRLVSDTLQAKGYVNADYYESIYAREAVHSTAIGMKTALPHSSFETVKQSSLMIVSLAQPILWGEDEVDLVVFISLTSKDADAGTKVLRDIYYKFYSTATHAQIVNAVSADEIENILRG